MLQKYALRNEPKLKIHRYVVSIGKNCKKSKCWNVKFHYCSNRNEVRSVQARAAKGAIVEVYSAVHNFLYAGEVK